MRFPAKPLSNILPLPVFSSRSYPTNVFFTAFQMQTYDRWSQSQIWRMSSFKHFTTIFFYGHTSTAITDYRKIMQRGGKFLKISAISISTGTQNSTTPRNQIQSNWAAQNILYRRRTFCILAMSSQDCLKKLCQSGWKTYKVWLKEFRLLWQQQLARADKILGLTVEGKLGMCNYWAKETVPQRKCMSQPRRFI